MLDRLKKIYIHTGHTRTHLHSHVVKVKKTFLWGKTEWNDMNRTSQRYLVSYFYKKDTKLNLSVEYMCILCFSFPLYMKFPNLRTELLKKNKSNKICGQFFKFFMTRGKGR